jgi:MFS family permease
VGGSLPVFIPVWPVILFSRVCAGLGVGVSCTLPPVLIMKFYEDNRQRSNIGIGSAVAAVGGWIGQVAAGILVGIEWNFVFSIYWLGLLGFVLILIGMPEPAPMEVRATEVKAKIQIPTPAILNVVMMFFAFMLFLPGLLMISTVVIGRGLGTGAHTGLVAGMFNISTIVLSVLFSFLYKVFKKFFAVILLALGTLGMVILYFASSLFAAGAGMFLLGAFLVLIPTLIMDNSKIVAPESITFATSLLISANNLGNFLAGPFVQASEVLGKNISIPSLLFGAIGLGILTVVYLFIRIFQHMFFTDVNL